MNFIRIYERAATNVPTFQLYFPTQVKNDPTQEGPVKWDRVSTAFKVYPK